MANLCITVCPRSSDPFYIVSCYTVCPGRSYPNLYNELLYKTGNYFLDIWHKLGNYFLDRRYVNLESVSTGCHSFDRIVEYSVLLQYGIPVAEISS